MSRSDLERELGQLRQENTRLKKLLRLTKREVEPATGDQSAWFDRRPGPVAASSRADDKVTFVSAVFQARHDVYAVRSENRRRGTSGFVPAVEGGWRRHSRPDDPRYLPLTADVLAAHPTGTHHVGFYPMLPGDEACWLTADFDGPAAIDALA